MTEEAVIETVRCPSWCARPAEGVDEHAHVSRDLVVEAVGGPLLARMVQTGGADRLTMLLNDRAASPEEARAFANGVQRLVDEATPAEPGLGFVKALAVQAGVGVVEMALASGLEASAVRSQQAGGQVLSVREFDRLALAVARLLCESALGRDQD